MKPILTLIVLVFTALVVGGIAAQDDGLNVVTTTTLVADIAQNIGGDLVTVTSLLPNNTDPHAYQFTPGDVQRVAEADMLLAIGAGYEAFLGGLLENAGEDVSTVMISEGIAILPYGGHAHEEEGGDHEDEAEHEHEAIESIGVLGVDLQCGEESHENHAEEATEEAEHHAHGECDPHVWMNPQHVMVWATNIAEAFAAADPANAETYQANAEAYIDELAALDREIRAIVYMVPEEQRILVTNHEFLRYFAEAYDFEIVATVLPGGSTSSELNPQDLVALIQTIEAEGVRVIFVETSANAQSAQIIADEIGVTVVDSLYSESLSDAGGPANTYINFMRYNAQTIADALSQ